LLERVRDGDWVEIDAEQGTVTLTAGWTRLERGAMAMPYDPRLIGAKAWNLGVVRSLGFRVPDFVLVNQEEAQCVARRPTSRASTKIVQRVLAQLGVCNGDKLAVRSSSVCEDREDGSLAGQFRSLLNVDKANVAAALRDFVDSNRSGRNGSAYRGSVIVQRMIRADCAGVCLTRDSRTRHGEAVIIEMTAGGNEGITGGTVRPERVVVDRHTGDILDEERRSDHPHRHAVDIAWMAQQFLILEARFGKPLDIEWALAGRELYILQARPIVAGHQVTPG
jgi:pyruvate,water dikinase